MRLGLVIVTYRCRAYALRCLESIARELPDALPDTVVVDNASGDGTGKAVRDKYPCVRVIERHKNGGFAVGANEGIQALPRCSVICLLNPDATVMDPELKGAAEYLEARDGVGVLGVRVENEDGTLQPSCRAFPGHLTAFFNRHSLATRLLGKNRWSRAYLMTDWPHDSIREVDWVSGSCMLIHRRAIDRIGLLDPGYFFSIEDVDYCRRAHDAGLGVVYYPMARVRHTVGQSSRRNVYRAMAAHHLGMWRYYRRHLQGGPLLDAATAAGITARFALHASMYTGRAALERARGAQAEGSQPDSEQGERSLDG